ncbi:PP2C family serine/threonine-protein phosphatase [Billgrantia saliphila]|uniref:PP2C family serine/threonine-protein phosphatase n=1 Tax=Billgrantia saliphila TaxID=1848458 RepID=UPI000CE3AB38|nr:PP2C family serine/threonine-protein phosphatase [Halomonas saliphila]
MPVNPGNVERHERRPEWQALAVAVAGLAHLEGAPPLPCQDAADAASSPRPMLAVADGAGSSPASELGARAIVSAMLRLVDTLETQLAWLLDADAEPDPDTRREFVALLVRHAQGTLEDRATEQRRPVRDLRCTLLLAVAGRSRLLWLKVGDGEIVLERAVKTGDGEPGLVPELTALGERGKGEFANQTCFVDERLAFEQVQHGCEPVATLTGIAAMSDGAAEKTVSHDGERVSGQLSHWFDDLRRERLRQRDLVRCFYSDTFCRGTSGDDRGIALLARDLDRL